VRQLWYVASSLQMASTLLAGYGVRCSLLIRLFCSLLKVLQMHEQACSFMLMLILFVYVITGSRKSLFNVFQDGICHPKMALVIDDRMNVWDEKDQSRVHVVPAFAPYYAPQAEV